MSQESERKRIAAELHGSLEQDLIILKNTALLGLNIAEAGSPAGRQFDEISMKTSEALEEAREIAHNLRPYHLDLKDALESMIEKIADSSVIRFLSEIDAVKGSPNVSLGLKESEMHLYRIVQESINNIIKHSGATEAKVSLKRDGRRIQLRIEDNGRGFNSNAGVANGSPRGFGLSDISERVRILGGEELITSAPGGGTIVAVTLKLPDQSAQDSSHE